jgi:hypothetical protein
MWTNEFDDFVMLCSVTLCGMTEGSTIFVAVPFDRVNTALTTGIS